jgi:hypothetical protein
VVLVLVLLHVPGCCCCCCIMLPLNASPTRPHDYKLTTPVMPCSCTTGMFLLLLLLQFAAFLFACC